MKVKRFLLSVMYIIGLAMSVTAQQKYLSFTAVAQNVDGLPNEILGISVNADGKEAAGATALGNAIVQQGWDIVGMSEDFNFHSELTAPLSTLYYIGTHGGKVSNLTNSTDGLGILLAKRDGASFADETRVKWNDHYGETDHGADGLIDKGFRYYAVTLAAGFVVDVYVLHMDAESDQKDIEARTSQLKQLAEYIKGHTHNRPILIIGDTNCRYTRDTLEEDLINSINSVAGLTIKDAWVELVRDGDYPVKGSNALMIWDLGFRKGEVVDKIFYINIDGAPLQIKANTYELAQPEGWPSDHWPAIVNFTLTDTTKEDEPTDVLPEKWTVDVPPAPVIYEVQGCQVEAGKTYYLMNVGSQKYIKIGGKYGTQAVEGSAATPITIEQSGSTYRFKTVGGYMYPNDGTHPYMDRGETNYDWVLTPVSGKAYQYYITYNNQALASTGDAGNPVYCVTQNTEDNKQKWTLMDEARIKAEMKIAGTSFNCTPLIPAADFDNIDFSSGKWTNMSNGGVSDGGSAAAYNYCGYYNSKDELNITQPLTAMPVGSYTLSFEGFYRYTYLGWGTDEGEVDAKVSLGGGNASVKQNTASEIGSDIGEVAKIFRDNDNYHTQFTTSWTTEGDMTFSVIKPECDGVWAQKKCWICLDNFQLIYTPNDATPYDPTQGPRRTVALKINETWEKVCQLGVAGQNAYDITTVLYRYNNGLVKTETDAAALCTMIDEAYAAALVADQRAKIEETIKNGGGDITSLLLNPGFELGDLSGWTYNKVGDIQSADNSNGTYRVENAEGNRVFNSYRDNDNSTNASYVKQSIVGIQNGLYEVKAKLTSFAGRTVFLIGNKSHIGVEAVNGKTHFEEARLLFLAEDGEVTVGAIGGNGDNFAYYYPFDGCFFKADDFRLAYVCDVAHGRLKLAIDKANAEAAKLDVYGKAAFNIDTYEAMYTNKSLTSDGKAEAQAVYAALNLAAKAQKSGNSNMTYAITNPNFESGDYTTGWSTEVEGDTKVAMQDNGTYTSLGCDGTYLFNSWNGDAAANPVAPIKQTVTGIPNGRYRLTAMVTTSDAKNLYISGNGTLSTAVTTSDANHMVQATVDFDVTDGTATISAFAAQSDGTVDATNGGWWYKADDFRLTYLGRELVLDENAITVPVGGYYLKVTLNRTIPAGKWSTLVLPFTTDVPAGLIAKKFDSDAMAGGFVDLYFTDATTFDSGVPYMVKPTGDAAVSIPAVSNVEIDMTEPELKLAYSTIHGTYVAGNVPQDTYFIYQNQYKYAVDGSNTIKGYRVYIDTTPAAEAKGVRYVFGFDGDGTTGFDGIVDTEAAKVVEIFSVDGRCLDNLQHGINIVKMSDGTTKKVFVK